MKKIMCIMTLACFIAFGTAAAAEKKAAAKPKQIEASSNVIGENHPPIPEGISCVECHEIKFDAKTTATQTWLTGKYNKWEAGTGSMSTEKLLAEITKMMGGKKKKKTCALGTCINNKPLTTSADYTLDPDKMVLYGIHEKGTEKLFHIRQNPNVSVNWHMEAETFGIIRCIQFIGKAEIIEGTNPEYDKILSECIPYEDLAKAYGKKPEEVKQMLKMMMDITKITVAQATVTNTTPEFIKDGDKEYRSRQRWVRK